MAGTLAPRGWRYADHIEYRTPGSLDELHGPTSGVILVPLHIKSAPESMSNLDTSHGLRTAYSASVRDGYADEQAALLDRAMLVRLWPDRKLPKRCRETWTVKLRHARWKTEPRPQLRDPRDRRG